MRRVLILGAGGHGQMAADILLAANRAGARDLPIGFLDDDKHPCSSDALGLPVLGTIAELERFDFDAVVVAIGNNRARQQIAVALHEWGIPVTSVIHPAAVISPDVELGRGVFVAAGVIVNTGSTISDGVILSTGCTLGHHDQIGPYAHVGPGAHLGGHVTVGEGALVGLGASVIPGRRVGDWAIVGAGAAVIDDAPSRCLVAGVPARVKKALVTDVERPCPLAIRSPVHKVDVTPQAAAPGVLPG